MFEFCACVGGAPFLPKSNSMSCLSIDEVCGEIRGDAPPLGEERNPKGSPSSSNRLFVPEASFAGLTAKPENRGSSEL